MTAADDWHRRNDAYLAAALAWLRLRLERLAAPTGDRRGPGDDAALARAAEAFDGAAAGDPPPALELLARRVGLARFERDVLLLAVAMELDTRMPSLCARAQGDPARPFPTFALALAAFDAPTWDALAPDRALRYWRLIDVAGARGDALTASQLVADERIVHYVKGLHHVDERLVPLLVDVEAELDADGLPASQAAVAERVVGLLARGAESGRLPMIQLVGRDPVSKQAVAAQVAAALGLALRCLPAALLPAAPAEVEATARLWRRETVLGPVALYVDADEIDAGHAVEATSALRRFLRRTGGVTLIGTREPMPTPGATSIAIEVRKPTVGEQTALWSRAVGVPNVAGDLACQFDMNATVIRDVAAATALPAGGDPEATRRALWRACASVARPGIAGLAQRIEPTAGWDDLVLPDDELALLRHVAEQARGRATVYDRWGYRRRTSRGLGITVLFAGESGTGKTLAAEVLAADLELDLYRIDLSAVVNKYIGETEKNLRRVFDAAEDGGAILFFDEADALFGKRSEVRDSHDRFANIEINYLLQRMEAYAGIAILATNARSALDAAFVRRLRIAVTFPFPGPAERRRLWEQAWPREVPRDDIDHARLARLHLAGGAIHSAALHAAFLAARDGTAVTMAHVLAAVRIELRKLERPAHEVDLRLAEPVRGRA